MSAVVRKLHAVFITCNRPHMLERPWQNNNCFVCSPVWNFSFFPTLSFSPPLSPMHILTGSHTHSNSLPPLPPSLLPSIPVGTLEKCSLQSRYKRITKTQVFCFVCFFFHNICYHNFSFQSSFLLGCVCWCATHLGNNCIVCQ